MRERLIRIKKLRKLLGITQVQLAKLLNVHPMTISKWEREVAYPDSYQFCMLMRFAIAASRKPGEGKRVIGTGETTGRGTIWALYELLRISYRVPLPDDVNIEDLKLLGYRKG